MEAATPSFLTPLQRFLPASFTPKDEDPFGVLHAGILLDDSGFYGSVVSCADADGKAQECGELDLAKQATRNSSSASAAPNVVVKGQWTAEEDSMLVRLVKQHGVRKWSQIAMNLVGRIGKQCRERWHNHLRPDIKKDTWTEEEERQLVASHINYGNRWAEIAKHIPGRSENSIKNHWNATKRRLNAKRRSKRTKNPKGGVDKCPPSSILQDYIKSKTLDVQNSEITSSTQLDMADPTKDSCMHDSLLDFLSFNDVDDYFNMCQCMLNMPAAAAAPEIFSSSIDGSPDYNACSAQHNLSGHYLHPTDSYDLLTGAPTPSLVVVPDHAQASSSINSSSSMRKGDWDLVEMLSLQLSSSQRSSSSNNSALLSTNHNLLN